MERGTPIHLSNNNQNNSTIYGNDAVIFNPAFNVNIVQQQTEADSKIKRLFTLLNPLVSSTRMGIDVPRDGCLAGTRLELLEQICAFANDPNPPHVCLILGLAGTGKSAIARSIADILTESGLSVVSYFISSSIPHSCGTERLVQTLAYQLAQQDGTICDTLLSSLDSNPGLLQYGTKGQVQQLLISSLTSVRGMEASPLTIIIDGLDEAKDVSNLISEVVEPISKALLGGDLSRRAKLILFSRESGALRIARFRGGLQGTVSVRWLHEVDENTVRSDIRKFIVAGLARLRDCAGLSPSWPTDLQVDALTDRAGSLFIYATTVLKFLGAEYHSPKAQLEHVLSSRQHVSMASGAKYSLLADLDALYLQVLFSIVGTTPVSLESNLVQRLHLVLATVIYSAEPLSTRTLAGVLGIRIDDIEPIIGGLSAIWFVPQDRDEPLFVHHLSFSEFLSDPVRCTDPGLCITSPVGHELLATLCLRKMTQSLRQDICHLVKPNMPLPRIEAYTLGIIEESINSTLRYACLHGVDTHLRQVLACSTSTPILVDTLIDEIVKFFDSHLLHWVEVRAILGEDSLIALMRTLQHLTTGVPPSVSEAWIRITQLLAELLDMVHEFQEIILDSPLETYRTCLLLLPSGSLVSAYAGHPDATVQRITSRPNTWNYARHLASPAATTVCIVTGGKWTACGLVETRGDLPVGQSYVLLWPAIPTAPFRLNIPHCDDLALQSIVFSEPANYLATLSGQTSYSTDPSVPCSLVTVWDLTTLRIVSLRRLTRILGLSFDSSSTHVLCVTCHPQVPVVCLPISLDGHILGHVHTSGWYEASFSADRTRVVFGQFSGPLFVAGESSLWRPTMIPQSDQPRFHLGWKPPTGSHGARILISSDGNVVVATFLAEYSSRLKLRAWNIARIESPQVLAAFPAPSHGGGIIGPPALSRNGRQLAFCAASKAREKPCFKWGELRWEGDQLHFVTLASWPCDGGILAQFSDDGRFIAGFDGNRVLRIWDVHAGHLVTDLAENPIGRGSFSVAQCGASDSISAISGCGPPDKSSLNLSFTGTIVIGSWNIAGKSHTVLVSPNGNSYRPSQLCRFSEFC